MYDGKCLELAIHFLKDASWHEDSLDSLTQTIQDAIEGWFAGCDAEQSDKDSALASTIRVLRTPSVG